MIKSYQLSIHIFSVHIIGTLVRQMLLFENQVPQDISLYLSMYGADILLVKGGS